MRTLPLRVRALFAAGGLALASGVAQGQLWLTGAPPGGQGGRIRGLSADGRVAAGWTVSSAAFATGFTWTAATGRYDFGFDPGVPETTVGQGISGDGRVVVGRSRASQLDPFRAFAWTPTGGYRSLGVVPGTMYSTALDADYSGSIIVGGATVDIHGDIGPAFRWTEAGGMQALPLPPGAFFSEAHAISGDGGTIVGGSRGGGQNAFIWTAAGGTRLLPESVPGVHGSEAFGINFDGSIIVGRSGATGSTATIWRNGIPEEIPSPSGFGTGTLKAISDDGQVGVGYLYGGASGNYAAVWTSQYGMEPLATMLTRSGITVPENVRLWECTAVSADGLTIAGYSGIPAGGGGGGFVSTGFVAHIPSPPGIAVIGLFVLHGARRKRLQR